MQVINPSIKYAPDPSMPEEKSIHRIWEQAARAEPRLFFIIICTCIMFSSHCSTHHKQYFLKQHPGSMPLITKAKVARSDHGLSRCKLCVCLLKSFIPDSFFLATQAKGMLFFCLVVADCVNSCLGLMQIAHLIILYTISYLRGHATLAEAFSAKVGDEAHDGMDSI